MASILNFPRKGRSVGPCFTDDTTFHWRADRYGVITEVGDAWTRLTGQTFAEVQNMGFLDVIHEEDRELVARRWHRSLSTGTKLGISYRLLLLTGEYADTVVECRLICGPDGRVSHWEGSAVVRHSAQLNVVNMS